MQRIVDLSGTLQNELWGYHELPGMERVIPPFRVETVATLKNNGFFSSRIEMSTVTGLYLESQAHVMEGGKTLDQYGPERFLVPAVVVNLPTQPQRAQVDGDMLAARAPKINAGDALLLGTGWGSMWDAQGYVLRCPNLKRSAMEWVLEQGVSLFGVDTPCIESSSPDSDDSPRGSLLRELFERDILLLAPLVNLEKVRTGRGTLVCLPLKLQGTSGAPCRAIFIEETEAAAPA